jgi:hypothetical protein
MNGCVLVIDIWLINGRVTVRQSQCLGEVTTLCLLVILVRTLPDIHAPFASSNQCKFE